MHTQTVTLEIPVPKPTTESLLWATLVALAAGDAVTTTVALSMGLPEGNPVIATATDQIGLVGVALSQVVYVALAWAVLRATDYGHKWVLLAGILPSALVVANNTAAIVFVSGVFG